MPSLFILGLEGSYSYEIDSIFDALSPKPRFFRDSTQFYLSP